MFHKIANISFVSSLLILILLSCSPNEKKVENIKVTPAEARDVILKRILAQRKLVATTDYNSTNYFVYRGEPMGYQYELLKSFADFLGVKLEIKIINDKDVKKSYLINRFTNKSKVYKGGFTYKNVLAGYPHVHFYSNLEFANQLIKKMNEYKGGINK